MKPGAESRRDLRNSDANISPTMNLFPSLTPSALMCGPPGQINKNNEHRWRTHLVRFVLRRSASVLGMEMAKQVIQVEHRSCWRRGSMNSLTLVCAMFSCDGYARPGTSGSKRDNRRWVLHSWGNMSRICGCSLWEGRHCPASHLTHGLSESQLKAVMKNMCVRR